MGERQPKTGINRRQFLRLAPVAGAGLWAGAWTASEAYVNRSLGSDYDVTPSVAELLKNDAKKVESHIKVAQFPAVKIEDELYNPHVNVPAIAQALTYLSYLDGGRSEVKKILNYLKDEPIEIIPIVSEDKNKYSWRVQRAYEPSTVRLMEISPDILPDFNGQLNDAVFNMLYDFVQTGRRNEATRVITSGAYGIQHLATSWGPTVLAVSAGIDEGDAYQRKHRNEGPSTRREVLTWGTALAVGAPVYLGTSKIGGLISRFNPEKWQRNKQAGDPENPGVLASEQCFDSLKGKFFLFDKVV